MSQQLKPLIKPATAADVPATWIANVGAILKRDGMAAQAGFPACTIMVQFIALGVWQPLNLPTNTMHFATEQDRDAVLEQIWKAQADAVTSDLVSVDGHAQVGRLIA
jgi:hypothetical protein